MCLLFKFRIQNMFLRPIILEIASVQYLHAVKSDSLIKIRKCEISVEICKPNHTAAI
jgi:hypothetical protein